MLGAPSNTQRSFFIENSCISENDKELLLEQQENHNWFWLLMLGIKHHFATILGIKS